MTGKFEAGEYYKGRYLESNRQTAIAVDAVADNGALKVLFFSVPGAMSYTMTVYPDEKFVGSDGVERLIFRSPSGKVVVVFADNRLYDSAYLKNNKLEGVA